MLLVKPPLDEKDPTSDFGSGQTSWWTRVHAAPLPPHMRRNRSLSACKSYVNILIGHDTTVKGPVFYCLAFASQQHISGPAGLYAEPVRLSASRMGDECRTKARKSRSSRAANAWIDDAERTGVQK